MGGLASGRYRFSSAAKCESTHGIDLAWLRRRGMLKPGNRPTLTWSLGGQKTGSIGVLVQTDGLRLMYAVAAHDGTKISVDELVPFVHTRHPVRRPTPMAHVHQMRPGLSQALLRAPFPLPAMPRTEVRFPERESEPARHASL